jgi:hypothetical protein
MNKNDIRNQGWKQVWISPSANHELWLNPNNLPMWIHFKESGEIIDIYLSVAN